MNVDHMYVCMYVATSFAVSGAIMWNDLHPQLRTITCLTSFFKRELRKTLC